MGTTGDGARKLFELTHILPADAGLLEEIESQPDEYFGGQKTFELWGEIARDAPKVFFGTGFTEAQAIIGNHLQQILSGEKSAEDGMREAAAGDALEAQQELRALLAWLWLCQLWHGGRRRARWIAGGAAPRPTSSSPRST